MTLRNQLEVLDGSINVVIHSMKNGRHFHYKRWEIPNELRDAEVWYVGIDRELENNVEIEIDDTELSVPYYVHK